MASEIVDPNLLEAYGTCSMSPLNKIPGIRPIGVGKVFRRIIGKVIDWMLKGDGHEVVGPRQTVSGFQGGAEVVIHSMKNILEDNETEAVILVDTSNTFNLLNRVVALTCKHYVHNSLSFSLTPTENLCQ